MLKRDWNKAELLTAEDCKAWIKALRSDKYKQGYGKLHTSDGHCCLGVLADIKGTLHNGQFMHNPDALAYTDDRGEPTHYYLPMGEPNTMELTQNTLMRMNDTGKTFSEIADFIEANMPKE